MEKVSDCLIVILEIKTDRFDENEAPTPQVPTLANERLLYCSISSNISDAQNHFQTKRNLKKLISKEEKHPRRINN